MTQTILCFGDSNTYGYDPRSYLGDRYPAEIRWTDRLAGITGRKVLNAGQNGREIPASAVLPEADLLIVMLGDNDLLQHPCFTAEDVTARMERFLTGLSRSPGSILLLSPPPMRPGTWVAEERLPRESAALSVHYGTLARQLGVAFGDAAKWDIPLLFDGVHFSPEGHQHFAAHLAALLAEVFPGAF